MVRWRQGRDRCRWTAAAAIAGLRAQAAELRRQAAILGRVDPAQERRLLVEAVKVDAQIRALETP
jgi:cobyrinic acid a,c-diamide synthase